MEHHDHVQTLESPKEYAKFAGVLLGILLASVLIGKWQGGSMDTYMASFMGVFFIVFGLFKLVGLEMFALTYRGYDVIAKRFTLWAYAFPFVELGLGLSYLIIGNAAWLNGLTILITATASIGVYKEIKRKSKFKCACLGNIIRLPLSRVSLVEDVAMFAMASIMLVV